MKNHRQLLFCLLLTLPFFTSGQVYQVFSPDRGTILTVTAGDSLWWSVTQRNRPVIEKVTVALLPHDREPLGIRSRIRCEHASAHRESLVVPVPCKDRVIRDDYNETVFRLNDSCSIEFRVFDDGVAYRFVTGMAGMIRVGSEIMDLSLPPGSVSWFPQEKSMISHNERAYLVKSPDTVPPGTFCSLPVLFSTRDSVRVLVTESGLYDYPGMFLRGTGTGIMKAIFPKVVLETRPAAKGPDRNEVITREADYHALTRGTRSFPWRVFVITGDDRQLVESNMVWQLSEPCETGETGWIRPGRVAWDWYNACNLTGVDFRAGLNTETYRHYIDFASRYGLEYVILDEGWSGSTTNILETNPDIDLPELIAYGKKKNVGIILWVLWKPLDGHEEEILGTYRRWGVKGIKVDFMQRSDQYMVNYYARVARVAAANELLVDFHGAFKPSGLNRTWPNVLTFEGVRGNENNKWSNYNTPDHNVTLSFTRMVAGPMDYTPGAMRNAQKGDFTISFNTPFSQGTRCHQAAMYIVYESPLQMLCDLPSLYDRDAAFTRFIAMIPTVWDETRVLMGKVGDYIAVARRNGDTWYVGAMTDWSPRDLEIDLSFLQDGDYSMEVMRDGPNADRNAEDYRRERVSVTGGSKVTARLAPGGGWAAVITKNTPRWRITGKSTIVWKVRPGDPHSDHIEMSGERVSGWIRYGVDSTCRPSVSRTLVFPSFRMKPNDTHGSMMYEFSDRDLPRFFLGMTPLEPSVIAGLLNRGLDETVTEMTLGSTLRITSRLERLSRGKVTDSLQLTRELFPSAGSPAFIERFVFVNRNTHAVDISMEYGMKEIRTDTLHSTGGPHCIFVYTLKDGVKRVPPGDSAVFAVVCQAVGHGEPLVKTDAESELRGRLAKAAAIREHLQLATPDTVLNTAFEFARLRVGESIYVTRNGPVNSPGGLRYYAAVWANDQAEYTGPWFGYAGYGPGREAAINAWDWFARYMNKDYNPIPSSIVAEGTSFWNGAGDRGDQAMIAYGAARFALACGDRDAGAKLWPLIEWCLEYCHRKLSPEGVVMSDSDELEGRFPSGTANLCTSSLYYDALLSASMLSRELGMPGRVSSTYAEQAREIKDAIGRYFSARVGGFDTYRYYRENDTLRSWICIPLTTGIFDRKKGTIDALFSPGLWTPDGLATQSGDRTFWDRSTLYALRGVLAAGETDRAMKYLGYYSARRLLGQHVPYPVEAWPEGGQKHLSAESALYCRIFTEGLFGIRPTGFRSFSLAPRLPSGWNFMALKNIRAFGNSFDIRVQRENDHTLVMITREGKKTITKKWNGKDPLLIDLRD